MNVINYQIYFLTGLITYRETNLIYDKNESSAINKERVAMVIAHEMAHQWFGNLMTVYYYNSYDSLDPPLPHVLYTLLLKYCSYLSTPLSFDHVVCTDVHDPISWNV